MKLPIYTRSFGFNFIFSCVVFDYSKISSHKCYVKKREREKFLSFSLLISVPSLTSCMVLAIASWTMTQSSMPVATVDLLGKLSVFLGE